MKGELKVFDSYSCYVNLVSDESHEGRIESNREARVCCGDRGISWRENWKFNRVDQAQGDVQLESHEGRIEREVGQSRQVPPGHGNLMKGELKAPICVVCHVFHGLALNLKKQ